MFPGNNSDFSAIGHGLQSQLFKAFPSLATNVFELSDADPKYNNLDLFHVFVKHHPAGSSLRCFEHFKQMIKQDKKNPQFQKFDFGTERNIKEYGAPFPPIFDFNLINIPIRGYVGNQDKLGNVTDNRILLELLRDRLNKDYQAYFFENCGHLTFMWGKNVEPLFAQILQDLQFAHDREKLQRVAKHEMHANSRSRSISPKMRDE